MRALVGRRGLLAAVVAATLVAAAIVVLVVVTRRGGESSVSERPKRVALPDGNLPDPVKPAFVPGKPVLLRSDEHVARWAPVRRAAAARAQPSARAPVVASLSTQTPEGTSNLVLVLEVAKDSDGQIWVRVRLPVLPNNSTGWVPRSALGGYNFVRTHLVIDRERLTATLYDDGRPVFRAPVGVGQPNWPTPAGQFYIRNKLVKYSSPVYGPLAFGTSARSSILTDWPAGGYVGIHGTNEPDILPGRVSHGCIRLRNEDILELAKLMPVGTPLTIR
jgi:lipoprotein-anchoring transpeptidase ErfK/SrfK